MKYIKIEEKAFVEIINSAISQSLSNYKKELVEEINKETLAGGPELMFAHGRYWVGKNSILSLLQKDKENK